MSEQGETKTYKFNQYEVNHKYTTDALILEKLARKGFDIGRNISFEKHEDGGRTYRQFTPAAKIKNAE